MSTSAESKQDNGEQTKGAAQLVQVYKKKPLYCCYLLFYYLIISLINWEF